MPGFDRRGPMGAGPMTGRGRGFCNPAGDGYETRFFGNCGFGRGMGSGRGLRGGYGPGMRRGFGRGFARRSLPPFGSHMARYIS